MRNAPDLAPKFIEAHRTVMSETDKTVATHVEGGTFPNWIGTDQKRNFDVGLVLI